MVSAELLALLRCPETRQTLSAAPAELLAKLEAQRAGGRLRDRSGKLVDVPIVEGLVRADGALFFPVRDGIPILLADDAIPLPR